MQDNAIAKEIEIEKERKRKEKELAMENEIKFLKSKLESNKEKEKRFKKEASERRLNQAVRTFMHRTLHRCWRKWAALLEQKRRAERVVQKMLQQNLSKCYEKWKKYTENQKKQRKYTNSQREIGISTRDLGNNMTTQTTDLIHVGAYNSSNPYMHRKKSNSTNRFSSNTTLWSQDSLDSIDPMEEYYQESLNSEQERSSPRSPNLPNEWNSPSSIASNDSMDSPRWKDTDSMNGEEEGVNRYEKKQQTKEEKRKLKKIKHADSLNNLYQQPRLGSKYKNISNKSNGTSSAIDLYSHTRHLIATPNSIETNKRKKKIKKRNNARPKRSILPSNSFATASAGRRKKHMLRNSSSGKMRTLLPVSVRNTTNTVTNPYGEEFPLTDELIDDAIAYLIT